MDKIIEAVKENKILYDLSHEDYKNTKKKNKVWDEIGKLLGIDGENAKKKFKNLRDSYAKHLRSEKTYKGQKSKLIDRYKMWPWVEQMSYFRPFLKSSQSDDNGNEENEGKLQAIPEVAEDPAPILQETQSNIIEQKIKLERNYDELDLLCLGYARTIKKMNPRLQTMTKFKIAKIIMEAELQQQEEEESTRSESRDSDQSTITYAHSENTNATTWYENFSNTIF